MKFLHAADIHLDSPPAGVVREGAVPRRIREDATRRAFSAMVDLALAEAVDFVLIAGDLYDRDQRDFGTALFFAREMRRLAPIPCVMIRGNHDAASVITRHLEPPPNVKILSSRTVETWLPEGLDVAIHGRSFPDRAVPEDLASTYPAALAGRFNIGLLHTSLEGAAEHETYAPCSVGTLVARGYDYWALGHIHRHRVVERTPPIIFPGNIQGRNPRETGAKGCVIVTAEGQMVADVTFHALDVMRWEAVEADLSGAETADEMSRRVRAALSDLQAEGRPLVARVTLAGASALHVRLVADAAEADAQCRAAALSIGEELHIERVIVATRPVRRVDRSALDALEPAFRAALADEAVMARLIEEARRLRAALPGQARDALPEDATGMQSLVEDAWAMAGAAFGP